MMMMIKMINNKTLKAGYDKEYQSKTHVCFENKNSTNFTISINDKDILLNVSVPKNANS